MAEAEEPKLGMGWPETTCKARDPRKSDLASAVGPRTLHVNKFPSDLL